MRVTTSRKLSAPVDPVQTEALFSIARALDRIAVAIEEHTRCEYPPEAIPKREAEQPQ